MQPTLSIIMCTARKIPRIDLLLNSLKISANKHPIITWELIIVDGIEDRPDEDLKDKLHPQDYGAVNIYYTHPKPNVWQGKYRKTSKDYWAKANALNTGICWANAYHCVFIDDSMIVDPDFLYWHSHVSRQDSAMAGSCRSIINPQFLDDTLTVFDTVPGDRQDYRDDGRGPKRCVGTWLFGSNWSAPTWFLYKVNGIDETYDGQRAFEDISLGVRLERSGCDVYYFPQCLVNQVLDDHLETFPDVESPMNNRMLLEKLHHDKRRFKSYHNFDLYSVRKAIRDGEHVSPWGPEIDWRTDRKLGDL